MTTDFVNPNIQKDELEKVATGIIRNKRGILAADESTGTIGKRFNQINLENTKENRTAYRDLLLTTKDLGKFIGGVILYEETLNAITPEIAEDLKKQDIYLGIKVDKGIVKLPGTDEYSTQGLDELHIRCADYYKKGARFAKWRAVLSIGESKPSELCISETAHTLARYAAICQDNGLVPIVEPEILSDGPHTIEQCAEKTDIVIRACVNALRLHGVYLPGILLKPNMVTSGESCPDKATHEKIGILTTSTLLNSLPSSVPGVVFLSGGQSELDASINLNEISKASKGKWVLSFSYGRALQSSVLKVWKGKSENKEQAQKVLLFRAEANFQAANGLYTDWAKKNKDDKDSANLFVSNYAY